jgi:predicted RNA-binding Zn ribbon-like protein
VDQQRQVVTEDPRPLRGEPLALDLLNTAWVDGGVPHDLLLDAAGAASWLRATGLTDGSTAPGPLRESLRRLREAIRAHLADPHDAQALATINDVLGKGRRVSTLTPEGPAESVLVPDGAAVAFAVADSYLALLRTDRGRIRTCSHPDCVLHFYDTSRSRNRAWCSMADCGNRVKAARHYARTRAGRATAATGREL